ncbi:hypothetical protein D3C87_1469780 [compost metagenome]
MHQHAFGDFQFEQGRLQTGVLEYLFDAVDKVPLAKIDGRYIDRHADFRQPGRLPQAGLSTGLGQHPFA